MRRRMTEAPTSSSCVSRRAGYRAAAALLCLILLGLLGLDSVAHADTRGGEEFLVIVNVLNSSSEASRELVAEAFLKKTTRWRNGESIRPVDLPPDSPTRRAFSGAVLKRSVAAVRSYWQQRIFTGRDVPPPELANDEAVVRYVLKYPGAVGYVASNTKLGGVKVLILRAN
jgi:ABC-type phosphate transport system substrate-binding protein